MLRRKRKKNWIGTISGTLSHYSGIFFKSGTSELEESGWWKLLDNNPPEILIAKSNAAKYDINKIDILRAENIIDLLQIVK